MPLFFPNGWEMFTFIFLSRGITFKSFKTFKRKFRTSFVFLWKYMYLIRKFIKNICNFCLNCANVMIFTTQRDIMMRNISWKFGECPTLWRHFTARDVIFLERLYWEMTSHAIKWRHDVGFSPDLPEVFVFIISCVGANI